MRFCWCGNSDLETFGQGYGLCKACGTLVLLKDMSPKHFFVEDDESAFYGKQYWLEHQEEAFGYADIHTRARNDLIERNLHWLKVLLRYCRPPAKVLELGCAHGSFVALLRQAGYEASGVEMSPWVVEFGQNLFSVPISVGPIEALQIPHGSFDVIALMDVLEHFPNPAVVMDHCLKLLKANGLLLIQTPQFKKEMNYKELVKERAAFLEQLKADEHIYLFSDSSITRLFQQLGAEHIRFETAIFGHYDMFIVVSRMPLANYSNAEIEAALTATPNGRLALALLDIYTRESANVLRLQADKSDLIAQLQASESDRAARLVVIEAQGQQLGRVAQLEAENDYLIAQLQASEADRAARLEVIEAQGQQLGRVAQLEAEKDQMVAQIGFLQYQLHNLRSLWLVKVLKRMKLISDCAVL